MKKVPTKYLVEISIGVTVGVTVTLVSYYLFGIGATEPQAISPTPTTTVYTFAPQTMEQSPGSTQIQAAEMHVDTSATYNWINKDVWYTQPSKNAEGKLITNLQLEAAEGKLPSQMCADITTDVPIVDIFTSGTVSFYKKVGKICVAPASREHVVELTTETRPNKIDVSFFNP